MPTSSHASCFAGLLRQPDVSAAFDNEPITCPKCGDDYMHLSAVQVHQGQTAITITGSNLVRNDQAGSSGRGSVVTLEMACESGHITQQHFTFHKGQVFATTVAAEGEANTELWRD